MLFFPKIGAFWCSSVEFGRGTGSQVDVILNKEVRGTSSFLGVCEAVQEASGNCLVGECSAPTLYLYSWVTTVGIYRGTEKHGVVLVTRVPWTSGVNTSSGLSIS